MATLDEGAPSDSNQFSAASAAVQEGVSRGDWGAEWVIAVQGNVSINATRMNETQPRRMGMNEPPPLFDS